MLNIWKVVSTHSSILVIGEQLLANINGYHHIIWKRVSSYALLCCGIVENVCTLVRGEEGPGVPIPSLQLSSVPSSILVFWKVIGCV